MKTEIRINQNKYTLEYNNSRYPISAKITNEEGEAFFVQISSGSVDTDDKDGLLKFLKGDEKIFKTDILVKGQDYFYNKWCYENKNDKTLTQEALELEFNNEASAVKAAEEEEERAKNTALSLLEELKQNLTSLKIKFREVRYTTSCYNSHWEVRVGNTTVATVGRDSYSSNSPRKWYWTLESRYDIDVAIKRAIEAQKELQSYVESVKLIQKTQNVSFELASLAMKIAKKALENGWKFSEGNTTSSAFVEMVVNIFRELPKIKSNRAYHNIALDLINKSNNEMLISVIKDLRLKELAPLGKFRS